MKKYNKPVIIKEEEKEAKTKPTTACTCSGSTTHSPY